MISGEQVGWREDGLAMKRRGGGTKHTHTLISCTCPDTVFLLHQRHMHSRDTLYCTPTHTPTLYCTHTHPPCWSPGDSSRELEQLESPGGVDSRSEEHTSELQSR